MQIVDERIERYALEHSSAQPPAMVALEVQARAALPLPQMLSGPLVGRLLELLVHSVQAKLVLEIGTYAGYSTLAMAAGLPPQGRILTCEISPEHARFAQTQFDQSPHRERIELLQGPALESIRGLPGPFDFVFIDAEKSGYQDYLQAVIDKLSPHGLIAADNTLFSGEVLGENQGDSARAIAAFNEQVAHDDRLSAVMLSVRDGITLIRRR
ncbi:MAG: O-methyltransferase [Solirubrobacteraceae bacterium]